VSGLNLTALDITVQGNATLLLRDVLDAIRGITQLQSLVLSGLGLSGPVESTAQPGMKPFQQLRHLDISNNPGIIGTLPSSWRGLTALQSINVSHTGIFGTLPAAYAALQDLRVFSAGNCTGLSGQLPPAWGLLNLEVLEITNSAISGDLPREWADSVAMMPRGMREAVSKTPSQSNVVPSSGVVLPGQGRPVALAHGGLQQLRVLDLSVAGPKKGGMQGTLPDYLATLGQLQVRCSDAQEVTH
jgi:hypothetical protein